MYEPFITHFEISALSKRKLVFIPSKTKHFEIEVDKEHR